jgi:DNA repair exonuclease SbcCD ATPase subunit
VSESYSQQVETVMKVFSRFSDNCIHDLAPPEYNKVYSWIAKCLCEFNLDKITLESRVREFEAERDRQEKVYAVAVQDRTQLAKQLDDMEAERDRLKERVEWFEKSGGVAVHAKVFKLRARLTALVEAAQDLAEDYERLIGDGVTNDNQPHQLTKLKAALADVK